MPKFFVFPNPPPINHQTILITGGTTGIGLATALLLQAEGARVIVTGLNPETLA